MAAIDKSPSDGSSSNEPVSGSDLSDHQTDVAVDAIEHHDSDEVLTAEDSKQFAPPAQKWYKRLLARKKLTIPAAIIIVLAILAAVPFTRYKIAGLVWKQSFTVQVLDAQTKQPITEAKLTLAGKTATTNNQGQATLKVKVGRDRLSFTKQYYKNFSTTVLVPILKQKGKLTISVEATGRQVPLKIVNKISGATVANALVSAAGTQARTDKSGMVTIVLPADKSSVAAKITASGYNDASPTITVTTKIVDANKFEIVPAGKIYFLSNLSGKIDVVKTNLDGTDRQTVLAGTGNEDPGDTVLLASRDWKYLALLTKRTASGNPELDLINTANDQLTNIDNGNAVFTPIGWSNDKFIYEVSRNTVNDWQAGKQVLKSFDAPTQKITVLDQTTASGTSENDYVQQQFGSEYIIGSSLVYVKNWFASYNYSDMQQLLNDQATLSSVNNDGTGQKVLKSFSLDPGTQSTQIYVTAQPYTPTDFYLEFYTGNGETFYEYAAGQVKAAPSSLNATTFYQTSYPTYLESPSGNQTFWAEPRDGKNTLFVGAADGTGGKQIATLSDYNPYGWYTDNYLLVQKNGSELYIMSVSGGTPLKLSDYYKPAQNFYGYGGGYGGL